MKLNRQTEVIKAAVQYVGTVIGGGTVKTKSGGGQPIVKVSVLDMIAEIQGKYAISDEEALYIKQVTEQKSAEPDIQNTVKSHVSDLIYLHGAYREHVNGEIRL